MSVIGVKEIQYPDGDSASPPVLVTGGKGIKQSFNINYANLGTNVTIDSSERAMVVGPYSLDSDVNLKINGVLTIV